MSINLLRHEKFIASAACVISMIILAPAVSFTPKKIDLQAFLLLQQPYCVSVLFLTSGCKSAFALYKRLVWRDQTLSAYAFIDWKL